MQWDTEIVENDEHCKLKLGSRREISIRVATKALKAMGVYSLWYERAELPGILVFSDSAGNGNWFSAWPARRSQFGDITKAELSILQAATWAC